MNERKRHQFFFENRQVEIVTTQNITNYLEESFFSFAGIQSCQMMTSLISLLMKVATQEQLSKFSVVKLILNESIIKLSCYFFELS